MDFAAYSELPGVNWSTLKAMLRSPKHYLFRLQNPPADTPAMRLGRATHTAVLEPDRLIRDWTVYDGRRAGNAWLEFAAVNADKGILSVDEWDKVTGIRDAVHAHRLAADLLSSGQAEKVVQWTDDGTGLECRGRLDLLTDRAIVDLKTTKDITPRAFGRTCDFFRYASQLAFYRDGIRSAFGGEADCYLIAVESEAPFDVAVYKVPSDDLWRGSDEAHALLERVAECMESGEWPGAYPERLELELPPWTWGEDDDAFVIEGLKAKDG